MPVWQALAAAAVALSAVTITTCARRRSAASLA
jgi:hypothetical protein